MKKALCFFGVAFLGLHVGRCQERATIFQIGKPDGDYHEFAIAGNHGAYSSRFPKDVDFLAGRSDPARQWPFIQPGPNDTWAGGKPHAFRISFMMPRAIEGYYRLVLDFVSAHYASPPRLTIDVNGTVLKRQLPPATAMSRLPILKRANLARCSNSFPPACSIQGQTQ